MLRSTTTTTITTTIGAMEALTGLPPPDLVIRVRQVQRVVSGVWDVGLTFTPDGDTVVY